MKIKYSPVASDKLKRIKEKAGIKTVKNLLNAINGLALNPRKCPTVENMLGIPSPYHFLHVEHNYIFYRVEKDAVLVADVYHEKEDFMWILFGIKLRTQESIDYWGE